MLTGTGKRYDIVAAFAQHTRVVACDPNPLAPAQYAATVRTARPADQGPRLRPGAAAPVRGARRRRDRPADRPRHRRPRPRARRRPPAAGAGARPATSPSRPTTSTPATCCCRAHGLPSPPTVLPGEAPAVLPGHGQADPRLRRAQHLRRRGRPRGRVLRRLHRRAGDAAAPDGRPGVLDRLPLRPRRPLPQRDPAHDARVARRRVDQGHGHRRRRADRPRPARPSRPSASAARRPSRRSATRTSAWASPTSTRASAAPSPRRSTRRGRARAIRS